MARSIGSVNDGAADELEKAAVASLDALYLSEYDSQVRRAFLMTGSRADAHDIVHDCLVAMQRRWSRIDNPPAYLNRSVTHGCRRLVKQRARLRPGPFDESAADPRASSAIEQIDLGEALLGLPFRQRAAVVLRYYGGLTEAEIAHALGIRPGSVGPTLHRALGRLREVIQ